MRVYSAVIERCPQTGLFVGFVPGFSGAHSQGETLDELNRNLQEVIAMLLEDGEPQLESEFVGFRTLPLHRHGQHTSSQAGRGRHHSSVSRRSGSVVHTSTTTST
jgi:predicted RNase H-like HicB family nuclease